jgi:hypothetical protein
MEGLPRRSAVALWETRAAFTCAHPAQGCPGPNLRASQERALLKIPRDTRTRQTFSAQRQFLCRPPAATFAEAFLKTGCNKAPYNREHALAGHHFLEVKMRRTSSGKKFKTSRISRVNTLKTAWGIHPIFAHSANGANSANRISKKCGIIPRKIKSATIKIAKPHGGRIFSMHNGTPSSRFIR